MTIEIGNYFVLAIIILASAMALSAHYIGHAITSHAIVACANGGHSYSYCAEVLR